MTPEEAAKIAQQSRDAINALTTSGVDVLETWRAATELLGGMIAITKKQGFTDEQAREIVANQFVLNCKTANFNMWQAQNGR